MKSEDLQQLNDVFNQRDFKTGIAFLINTLRKDYTIDEIMVGADISRESIYKFAQGKGNPTMKTLAGLFNLANIRMELI